MIMLSEEQLRQFKGQKMRKNFKSMSDSSHLKGGLLLGVAFAVIFGSNSMLAASIAVTNTGNGSTTDGSVDPNWKYSNSAGVVANAFVSNNPGVDFYNGSCCGGGPWTPDTSTSSWIVDNVGSLRSGGNPLSFSTTFGLAGLDPSTAVLTGAWGVDDGGQLELNGVIVSSLPGQVASNWDNANLTPFSVSSGFIPGLNTLAVVLTYNDNAYEGVNVRVSGTATPVSSTPEPTSLALLVTGVLTFGALYRRAHKEKHRN